MGTGEEKWYVAGAQISGNIPVPGISETRKRQRIRIDSPSPSYQRSFKMYQPTLRYGLLFPETRVRNVRYVYLHPKRSTKISGKRIGLRVLIEE